MTQASSTESEFVAPAPFPWFEWALGIASCAVLFGPLIAVGFRFAEPPPVAMEGAAETVGIAVILRAMLRRLFRSGTRSVMQTALGTVTRASSRALSRRVIRVGVKSVSLLVRTDSAADAAPAPDEKPQPKLIAIGLGYLGLTASLYGILAILEMTSPNSASSARSVVGDMSFLEASLLGASPLLAYAALLIVAAPKCGVEVRFRTSLEGLLLQGYFTGSGSFLPLATDTNFLGEPAARAKLAGLSIAWLYLLHSVFLVAARSLGSFECSFLSGMFLLYCFVFVFPIAPLDGYYLWSYSRKLWLLIGAVVLASFMYALPDTFNVIL